MHDDGIEKSKNTLGRLGQEMLDEAERRGHRGRTTGAVVGGALGAGMGSFAGPLGATVGGAMGAGLGALLGEAADEDGHEP